MKGTSANRGAWAARRRAALARAGARAVLVSGVEDVAYLTGFSGDDSFLLLGRGRGRKGPWACLLTDGRYDEQARRECPGIEVRLRKGKMSEAVRQALAGRGVRRLTVQSEHLTLQFHEALKNVLRGCRLAPRADLVAQLRQVKDAAEVRAIRQALRIAERAFRELVARGARAFVGRTERELAAELDYRMRRCGADAPAFETIVAAGANASRPHYRPGPAILRRGQPVLIDWGARAAGYGCDLTRVVFLLRADRRMAEVYEVVRRAQRAGLSAVRAGATGRSADAAARAVIRRAGYGDCFVHGLGHGLGRQVHERPSLGALGTQRLRAGMVVTVEPGIYLPGVGGVRIEDDVLVRAGGCRRLSTLSNKLSDMILR